MMETKSGKVLKEGGTWTDEIRNTSAGSRLCSKDEHQTGQQK